MELQTIRQTDGDHPWVLEECSDGTGGRSGDTWGTGLCARGPRGPDPFCGKQAAATDMPGSGRSGALTIPRACLIIKTHTSHTEANTWRGGIGTLQRGLDPSPSKSGTSARESNTYLWIRWAPSRIRCITY